MKTPAQAARRTGTVDSNPTHANRIPDDHSAVEPRLPFPNRTVKRRSADDSAGNYRVKVGHRQEPHPKAQPQKVGLFYSTRQTGSGASVNENRANLQPIARAMHCGP